MTASSADIILRNDVQTVNDTRYLTVMKDNKTFLTGMYVAFPAPVVRGRWTADFPVSFLPLPTLSEKLAQKCVQTKDMKSVEERFFNVKSAGERVLLLVSDILRLATIH